MGLAWVGLHVNGLLPAKLFCCLYELPHTPLVGFENDVLILDNRSAVPQKVRNKVSIWTHNAVPRYIYPREIKTYVHKNKNFCTIVPYSPKGATAPISKLVLLGTCCSLISSHCQCHPTGKLMFYGIRKAKPCPTSWRSAFTSRFMPYYLLTEVNKC